MYRIIKVSDGVELGITDTVLYIKYGRGGCFTPAKIENAIGVVFNNTTYNLVGHNEIEGAETVVVSKADAGQLMMETATYTELATAIREGVNEV